MTDNSALIAWYISGPTDAESQKIISKSLRALTDKGLEIFKINSEKELRKSTLGVRLYSLPRPSVLLFGEGLPDAYSSEGKPMFENEVLKIIIDGLPPGNKLFVIPFSTDILFNTERFNDRKIYEIGVATKLIDVLGINPHRALTQPDAEERQRKFAEELNVIRMMFPYYGKERR